MKVLASLRSRFRRKRVTAPVPSELGLRQEHKSSPSQVASEAGLLDPNDQFQSEVVVFQNEFASRIELFFSEDFETARKLCIEFWKNFEGLPLLKMMSPDEFQDRLSNLFDDYNRTIKFADFLLRDMRTPESIRDSIIGLFQKGYTSHQVIRIGNLYRIVASLSQEDAYAQSENLTDIFGARVSYSSAYLERALEHLRDARYLESIKESINALENSVCALDSEGSNKTLPQSLSSLKKGDIFNNPNLQNMVKKLWDFANETPGIRHGNKDPSEFVATRDQAMLIFSLATAWCAYLDKQHQIGSQ